MVPAACSPGSLSTTICINYEEFSPTLSGPGMVLPSELRSGGVPGHPA
ncbi:hypothetical protein ASZ90_016166 [hydrocarbon metagenome]|uniref:Uncharacterized protein n=1 Tax=hydrocarbon metagenome TaxID=938273 RepID=A0A0W8F071_9ZZZZ